MHSPLARLFFPAALVCAMIAVAGCETSESNATAASAAPPKVGVLEVQARDVLLDTEVAGRTVAHLIAEVRPQVGGIVRERLFEEGSEVEAGQVLYEIDPATYQATVDSARAVLARDEAKAEIAALKLRRYSGLHEKKAVSDEDYDEVRAELKQARATVAMDQAALAAAEIDLAYTRVAAPIAGRVGRSAVTPGALVTANQATALATVYQLDPIYVDVTQSSVEMLRLKRSLSSGLLKAAGEDASVELILEDGSRYTHRGRLQFSEVSVDQQTGTVTLRAVFPNPEQELLPGMYVRAVLHEGTREHAVLVPQRAVTRDASGTASALILNADDKVEARELSIARAVGNDWLVDSGLNAGDRLIIDGVQKIRAGATAEAVPHETVTAVSRTDAAKHES